MNLHILSLLVHSVQGLMHRLTLADAQGSQVEMVLDIFKHF